MEKVYTMEFTAEELVYLFSGITLSHKEAAKNFYESLEGLKTKKKELSIDEFDKAHNVLMGLNSKLGDKIKDILSEEANKND